MARNYLALKDNYQASYTCDQIIENYQDFPEIVSEAREVKVKLDNWVICWMIDDV